MKKNRFLIAINIIGCIFFFLSLLFYQNSPFLKKKINSIIPFKNSYINQKILKEKLSFLSNIELQKMYQAGIEIIEGNCFLTKKNSSIIQEVLIGEKDFFKMQHYPLDDVFDWKTSSQYYYHSHRPKEHGHFHLFLREEGMEENMKPLFYNDYSQNLSNIDTYAHIIAISMNNQGDPISLFTTNRWVTEEDWYLADDVKIMVESFYMDQTHPSFVVNRWLNHMLVLFKPQIFYLIDKRDRIFIKEEEDIVLKEKLEDRNIEIISETPISIDVQMKLISELLEERGALCSP